MTFLAAHPWLIMLAICVLVCAVPILAISRIAGSYDRKRDTTSDGFDSDGRPL